MIQSFLFALLLGYGAAVPIGPMNVEIARRNLRFGTRFGICFGLGACTADLVYLVLIAVGALAILQTTLMIQIVGIIGGLLLTWFGISALRLKEVKATNNNAIPPSIFKNYLQGLGLTLLNPITIIFWGSVSSHIVLTSDQQPHALAIAGAGVAVATLSWVFSINTLLHRTKHRLSDKITHKLNTFGGIILLIFAMISFYESLLG